MKRPIKIIVAAMILFIFNICLAAGYYSLKLPDSFTVQSGERLSLTKSLSVSAYDESVLQSFSLSNGQERKASLRLFGIVPVKDVKIKQIDRPMLIPGGQPFGIKLLMEGVMVVGTDSVMTDSGSRDPAGDCGIAKGDIILTANYIPVSENKQIEQIVSRGKPVDLIYRHGGERKETVLTPVWSEYDNAYKAGLWVRDSTAGIGTVTFAEPETLRFGGLGHPVCDCDTGSIIPVSSGESQSITITKIVKGESGSPGELHGSFSSDRSSGIICKNCESGIFGKLFEGFEGEPIPLAMKQEVREGSAIIRTTVDETGPHDYTAEIDDIDLGSTNGKNLTLRVTDKRLKEKTGGIIQGMSGSPIIQDGRLVGAVTHVLVNSPEKGYGIFAENMYEQGLTEE